MNSKNSSIEDCNNPESINQIKSSIFKTVKFNNSNSINYNEYYIFKPDIKLYLCKICSIFPGTIKKGNVIRHLDEKHFNDKTKCVYCGNKVLRIDEHIKRCKAKKSKNEPKYNILNNLQINNDKSENVSKIKFNISDNMNNVIKKTLLKDNNKVYIGNIYFYKNKPIGKGAFCNVYLGSCNNLEDILAIKIIELDNEDEFNNYFEEKGHLISLKNKGNFPVLYDWYYDGYYLYFAESLMGPSLKELIHLCCKQIDIISVIHIAIDLISQIEIIHDANILHGDIKLTNVCYGNLSKFGDKYCRTIGYIDFGNSMIFKSKNKIIKMENNVKSPCTREYSSLNLLNGITMSRRDDLESIFYLIIKIYTGKLPWEKIINYKLDKNIILTREKCNSKYIISFILYQKYSV